MNKHTHTGPPNNCNDEKLSEKQLKEKDETKEEVQIKKSEEQSPLARSRSDAISCNIECNNDVEIARNILTKVPAKKEDITTCRSHFIFNTQYEKKKLEFDAIAAKKEAKAAKIEAKAAKIEAIEEKKKVEILIEKNKELQYIIKYIQQRKFFEEFLIKVKIEMIDNLKKNPPTCFISYAWEKEKNKTDLLHQFLVQLQKDLSMAGVKVVFDITDMASDMNHFMIEQVNTSNFVFLIGTPTLKEKLKKIDSNAYFEYYNIIQRYNTQTDKKNFLLALIFEGDRTTSFPDSFENTFLLRDFTGCVENLDKYIDNLSSLLKPKGLIPTIFDIDINNMEYGSHKSMLDLQTEKLNVEIELLKI